MNIQDRQLLTTDNIEEPIYQVSKLLEELGKRGHRATSKPTYLKYEDMGIFKPGRFSLIKNNRVERVFTIEEIAENIARYERYVEVQAEKEAEAKRNKEQ